MNRIIAIHQPNLFPWLGFFHKIAHSDTFVYLDDSIHNIKSGSWFKRVKLLINKQEYWLTINLKKPKKSSLIALNQVIIEENSLRIKKQLKTIEQNYKKAPFFDEVFSLIENYFLDNEPFLVNRNIKFIENACNKLSIFTKRLKSSELNCHSSSNERLIEIIKKLNGNIYLAGGGASGYQVDEKFVNAQIKVASQNFKHPKYIQFNSGAFLQGLSIIDALMNVGFQNVKTMLKARNF